jgi:hypothetical protein
VGCRRKRDAVATLPHFADLQSAPAFIPALMLPPGVIPHAADLGRFGQPPCWLQNLVRTLCCADEALAAKPPDVQEGSCRLDAAPPSLQGPDIS